MHRLPMLLASGLVLFMIVAGSARAGTLPNDPALVGNLKLWLRGDDLTAAYAADDPVASWADVSGLGNDAATRAGYADPKFMVDVPGLRFAQTAGDLMEINNLLGDVAVGEATIIGVYRSSSNSNLARPLGFGSYSVDGSAVKSHWNLAEDTSLRFDGTAIGASKYSSTLPAGFITRTVVRKSGDKFDEFFNGTQALADGVPSTPLAGIVDEFYLGDIHTSGGPSGSGKANLDVAEVIIYDRALTTAEREGVETYLAGKYRSSAYLRFDEGTAGQIMPGGSGVMPDHSINANNAAGYSNDGGTRPIYSADVLAPVVPLTGSANNLSLSFDPTKQNRLTLNDHATLDFDDTQALTLEAWVKLNTLADPSDGLTPAERQYVLWKKATNVGDAALNYGLLAQAGTIASNSPNSLVFAVGNGSAINLKVSTLQITDNQWHYISAAFDPAADTVRFVLDGQTETFTDFTATMAPNNGPLVVGGHFNSVGSLDSTFDGLIDEVRITAGFLDETELIGVPEPGSLALLAIGLAALLPAVVRRRSRVR